MRIRINHEKPLISIACGQFALSLMQVVFMFYYVKVYLVVFRVPQLWFNIAQTLFMFWNAINDPLFGYMQDKPGSWLNSRVRVIRIFAPFLVLSFVFMWIPWSEGSHFEGLHLIVSLFLFDAFHSVIGVAWSALFADSTKEPDLRVSAMKYSQISILISVNIIVVTEKLSRSLERFWVFQLTTVFVAGIAFLCLLVAGSLKNTLSFVNHEVIAKHPVAKSKEVSSMLTCMWEIFCERDFIAIVAANFVHSARSITHMNFASTATDLLIPQAVVPKGSLRLSLFYGALTLGPQILLIMCKDLVVKNGAYRLLMMSYKISVLSGLFLFVSSNPYCIMLFMLLDSITVHSTAPLFNIIISDFIDDDAKRHFRSVCASSLVASRPEKSVSLSVWLAYPYLFYADDMCALLACKIAREAVKMGKSMSRYRLRVCYNFPIWAQSALSSLVFSMNALFVKPAQSVAPVLVVYILNQYGYSDYISNEQSSDDLVFAMRTLLLATPVLLGSLQYYVFKSYSLGKKHALKTEDI